VPTERLDGKVAAVTGASSGIGAATAVALARAGADVGVAARRADRLDELVQRIEADGGRAKAFEVDVSDEAQARAFVDGVAEDLGRLDILVNNAGVMLLGPVHGADVEDWRTMVNVNVLGLLYCVHAALPIMEEYGAGDIVNISSVAGRAGQPRMGAYCATKFAIVGLTQQLALELAPDVRVNCICPGSTDTDMMDGTFARRDAAAGAEPGTARAARIASLPMRRQGTPGDIGSAVAFLASPAAGWITGQTLNVDGGQRMD
jgi:NAD(P)-dependent dehydrogenase (short-subunit alcohol dehydrogenase family)